MKNGDIFTKFKKIACLFYKEIDSVGKKIIWSLSIVFFVSVLVNVVLDAFKTNVYIEQVNIAEEIIESGYSQKFITDLTILELQKIINSVKNNDIEYIYRLKKDNQLGVESCYSPLTSSRYIKEVASTINFDIKNNSEIIEVSIPETTFSLKQLSILFRKLVGQSNIILNSNITKIHGTQNYSVQVIAKYNSGYSHKSEFKTHNLKQAKFFLTLLMLKYSNPEIFSFIVFEALPRQALDSINTAIHNLSEYRVSSAPYTLLGFLYLERKKESLHQINLLTSQKYFAEAIKKNPNDSQAIIGNVLAHVEIEKYSRDMDLWMKNTQLHLNALDNLIDKKIQVYELHLLKAIIYRNINKQDLRKNELDIVLKNFRSEPLVQSAYVQYLIEMEEFDKAENFVDEILNPYFAGYEYISKENSPSSVIKMSPVIKAKLRLLLAQNRVELIPDISGHLDNCGRSEWSEELRKELKYAEEPSKIRFLKKFIPSFYSLSEKEGVEGADFYISWAIFYGFINEPEKQLNKYRKSLQYPGDLSWSLINISSILGSQGRFKESEIYAKKSMTYGNISAAYTNYLAAIYGQRDYKKFLTEYEIYNLYLTPDYRMFNLILSGIAECKIGNHEESRQIIEQFKDKVQNMSELFISKYKELESCLPNK